MMNMDEFCCDLKPEHLKQLDKNIKKHLMKTSIEDREDLQQEIYIKIFEKMDNIEFKEKPPRFWSFFEKEY